MIEQAPGGQIHRIIGIGTFRRRYVVDGVKSSLALGKLIPVKNGRSGMLGRRCRPVNALIGDTIIGDAAV